MAMIWVAQAQARMVEMTMRKTLLPSWVCAAYIIPSMQLLASEDGENDDNEENVAKQNRTGETKGDLGETSNPQLALSLPLE
eukprot:scaffold177619_cov15-Tisochrysis_lutea.AAC.1